jgi:hypothetical protein
LSAFESRKNNSARNRLETEGDQRIGDSSKKAIVTPGLLLHTPFPIGVSTSIMYVTPAMEPPSPVA